MSLLIACITPQYIIVVSDQRLREWSTPGKLGTIIDGCNKVVAQGPNIFSFVGVGKLGEKSTDQWLAESLATQGEGLRGTPFPIAVEHLKVAATQWFGNKLAELPALEHTRLCHAFVGVGIVPTIANNATRLLSVISNVEGSPQEQLEDACTINYQFDWLRPPSKEFKVTTFNPQLISSPLFLALGENSSQTQGFLKLASRAIRDGRARDQVKEILAKAIPSVARNSENISPEVTVVACEGTILASGAGLMTGTFSKGTLVVMGEVVHKLE